MTYRTDLIRGNLASDPELRYLDNGTAVVSLRVIENPWVFNADTQKRERSTEKVTHRVQAWRQLAINVTESLRAGDPVVVRGTLKIGAYLASDGEAKPSITIDADLVAPDLRLETVSVSRSARDTRRGGAAGGGVGVSNGVGSDQGAAWPTVAVPGQSRG